MFDRHYKIKYHTISITGNVRESNEDNYCSCSMMRTAGNIDEVICDYGEVDSRSNKLFAVFDGMGGEQKGEVASFIAADVAVRVNFDCKDIHSQLLSFTSEINRRVRAYADKNDIEVMGTTFAGVVFSEKDIYVSNVGDSKVFGIRNGKIIQHSVDHVLPEELAFRNIITQYIGMGENSKYFDPAVKRLDYSIGDRYIICTDGLTERLSTTEIGALCSVAETVTDATDILVSQAVKMGSKDNITVTVCEIAQP